ncbi:MAG: hypothetical protein WB998_12900 [Solirubrobacteraceae bacterium]
MAKPDFVTLAEALVGPAEAIESYFENLGYRVQREPTALAYPYAPTMRCKRNRTTIVVELDDAIRLDRASEWVRYGCSLNSDFRVAVATPAETARDLQAEDALRAEKAGIYIAGGPVMEVCAPHDLSLNLALPELAQLPHKVRKCLGPMYEQFEHSHWREGFESGCQAFEVECRKYLKAGMASGRIVVLDKRQRVRTLTDEGIDRMSLGQLKVAFGNIQTPNHADTALADILAKINPARVGVAHHKTTPATEVKLRKNVGRNVWLLVAGLRKVCGEERPRRTISRK